MNKLSSVLDQLELKITQYAEINPMVSEATVGWHIEHSLLVIIQIIEAMKNADPSLYQWRFNKKRTVVFFLKSFPRGRANAPASVLPKPNITPGSLIESFAKARKSIKSLDSLSPNHYFTHPFFGQLNIKPSRTFFAIHTNHHLKIINDIIFKK
jgi:hypothetical protein